MTHLALFHWGQRIGQRLVTTHQLSWSLLASPCRTRRKLSSTPRTCPWGSGWRRCSRTPDGPWCCCSLCPSRSRPRTSGCCWSLVVQKIQERLLSNFPPRPSSLQPMNGSPTFDECDKFADGTEPDFAPNKVELRGLFHDSLHKLSWPMKRSLYH